MAKKPKGFERSMADKKSDKGMKEGSTKDKAMDRKSMTACKGKK